jgi:3alpha(or 20beta)-hydroxysteroid dehydrogenase
LWLGGGPPDHDRHARGTFSFTNAGGSFGRGSSLEKTSLGNYEFIVGLNLTGVWLGMRTVIEPMRSRGGGSIINVSSIAGRIGFPNMAAYTAAKWGLCVG